VKFLLALALWSACGAAVLAQDVAPALGPPRQGGAAPGETALGTGGVPELDILPIYGFKPAQWRAYYDATSLYAAGASGAGQNIAMVECGPPRSLYFFLLGNHFNNTPRQVLVDFPRGGVWFPQIFPALDVEQVIATAPSAAITLYVTAPICTWGNMADAFAAILKDMPAYHYVSVVISYSNSESYFAEVAPTEIGILHATIAKLTAAGATVFADSGVWGAGPPTEDAFGTGQLTVEYPASDPLVVGVGGTSAVTRSAADPLRADELAWGYSGGGVSSLFARPSYQSGAGYASATMRNVPDVAFDADTNTCIEYVVAISTIRPFPSCQGGTFIGDTTFAGLLAVTDQLRAKAGKKPLTNVSAALYAAARVPGNFLPISRGCNDYFCASSAPYNNVTGLGVPDIAKLVKYLVARP
jgi:kumamolisin